MLRPGSLELTRSRASLLAGLLREAFKLTDAHFAVREDGANFQPPPEGFHVARERTKVDVGSVLDLRHLPLIHSQGLREGNLGHLARPAHPLPPRRAPD